MGLISYLKDSKTEIKHINWPSRGQAIAYTGIVVLVSLATALYLGFLDELFASAISKFLSR